jgi:hypothetical protein
MSSRNNQENLIVKITVTVHVEGILYHLGYKVNVVSKFGPQTKKFENWYLKPS